MQDFTQYFLYIPGIVIFLLGSGQVRNWLTSHRHGSVAGLVVRCEHVVKKDKKDREVFNYFNTTIEYVNPKTGNKEIHAIKTPTEYAVGQQVRLTKTSDLGNFVINDADESSVFHPVAVMLGGALTILIALWTNQGNEIYAMGSLGLLFMGAGVCLIYNYVSISRMGLKSLEAEIIDTYKRQISKSTKILRGDKIIYYPVVKYEMNRNENIMCLHVNSEYEKTFPIGDKITLFYDEKSHQIRENNAKPIQLIVGILLFALGVAVALSITAAL
ncbi:DUF3592 domain-containing protein [Oribacterium sp. FC2011]|uniref:DUF3592 domain-containing protein n=1 Tax=Oribacterium sp. FC2011 TaxID=1408311 RepID=UPI0004E0E2FE|nr:DUF3592 domain-containing protein [Oribacterium sp. FC2011]